MVRSLFAVVLAALLAVPVFAADTKYTLSGENTKVEFTGKKPDDEKPVAFSAAPSDLPAPAMPDIEAMLAEAIANPEPPKPLQISRPALRSEYQNEIQARVANFRAHQQRIFKHTDSLWKGITVQFYLPGDNSTPHIGTIFHEVLPNGRKPKKAQMPFSPNTGYAFAVADNTWHSADPVGPEVKTRDSILLTYFVDAGPWRFVRNRGRRLTRLTRIVMRRTVIVAPI